MKLLVTRVVKYGSLLVISVLLIYMIIIRVGARPRHIPDRSLLAPAAIFPTVWSTGLDSIAPVLWEEGNGAPGSSPIGVQLYDPAFRDRGSWISSEQWGIGMDWHAHGATALPYLNQEASMSPTAIEAILKYQALGPGDTTTWERLPFHGAIQTSALTPTVWDNTSPYASAQRAVCAVGTLDACELWYAWIRYGQYIYQVLLLTPEHGMNELTFYQFIQDIDADVGPKY